MHRNMSSSIESESTPVIHANKDHFPLSIVWSPIPGLTWLIPFVGHLGIASSEGVINDFAGPYYVNRHKSRTGFGTVTKYVPIDLSEIKNLKGFATPQEALDNAIECASKDYDKRMHNLILDNCHDHVANALNRLEYKGIKKWNSPMLAFYMVGVGKFVSFSRFLKTYLPFLILVGLIVGLVLLFKFIR